MKFSKLFLVIILCVGMLSCKTNSETIGLVHSVEEFNQQVSKVQPGDHIILANGVWNNAELLFEGNGTVEKPITLSVEEKGKVTLEGNSNLRLAGNYLVVEGLVFKNGFTNTTEVISFKKDAQHLANNSRLTECVIDNYSNPERQESDYWIGVYGKNNRIDHNHIAGKSNLGVTMAVRLNAKESQENNHQIDHNYFGPRPNLGSNGGETLRIGTSHFSLTNSKTIVAYNYFDRCNGEHEIISNKSGQNTYRYNMFYECTGTLTMRHGNETLVEGNVFNGNNKPSTGGIRIINGQQKVVHNYAYGLKGYRFRGALVVMNGVPNSPINRYGQVKDAVVENNVFVNCDYIQLGAGSDAERSAVPENSILANNVFYHDTKKNLFTVYDDMSGITFKKNVLSAQMELPFPEGFKTSAMTLKKNEMGFMIPVSSDIPTSFSISKDIATKENTGVSWYSKKDTEIQLGSGKTIVVEPGMNTLYKAALQAAPGDILQLKSGGEYNVTKFIEINSPLSISFEGKDKPVILFEKSSLFNINNGGSLLLKGIKIDGENAPDYSGNSVIRTSKYSMNKNYKLFVDHCDFTNLDVNHSFDVLEVYKSTFADTISITNSNFKQISGNIMELNKEDDDIGVYNAEYVIMKNNTFSDVGGVVLNLYRGGTDESTFGPFLEIDHSVFENVGGAKRNKKNAAISLYGVQEIHIKNSIFIDSKPINVHLVVGEPIVAIENLNFFNSDKPLVTGDQKYTTQNLWTLNPDFEGETHLLKDSSPLKNKATDGADLGIIVKK